MAYFLVEKLGRCAECEGYRKTLVLHAEQTDF